MKSIVVLLVRFSLESISAYALESDRPAAASAARLAVDEAENRAVEAQVREREPLGRQGLAP